MCAYPSPATCLVHLAVSSNQEAVSHVVPTCSDQSEKVLFCAGVKVCGFSQARCKPLVRCTESKVGGSTLEKGEELQIRRWTTAWFWFLSGGFLCRVGAFDLWIQAGSWKISSEDEDTCNMCGVVSQTDIAAMTSFLRQDKVYHCEIQQRVMGASSKLKTSSTHWLLVGINNVFFFWEEIFGFVWDGKIQRERSNWQKNTIRTWLLKTDVLCFVTFDQCI